MKLITNRFSSEEKFKLIDQIISSSCLMNTLIAECHGRFTYPDQIHFYIQARGTLAETINHLIDAFDEGYITNKQLETFKNSGKEIERLLNGYLSYLRKKRDEEKS
jgi:four helix bundle protein